MMVVLDEKVSVAFEEWFDMETLMWYMKSKWYYTVYGSVAYLVFIFGLRYWMKKREPFEMRRVLVMWNIFLATFNAVMAWRAYSACFPLIVKFGAWRMFCDFNLWMRSKLLVFWVCAYQWSKLWDFGDTLFIVLRKRPLTFLHVIHHSLTLVAVWYFVADGYPGALCLGMNNGLIHAIMYSYYAAKMLGFRVPKTISIALTTAQMLQLLFGWSLAVAYLYARNIAAKCDASLGSSVLTLFTYSLYLVLFFNFFLMSYVFPKKSILTQENRIKQE